MKKILEKCMESREIISIYPREEDNSTFHVGRVVAVDDECFIFNAISTWGTYDGLDLYYINDIIQINIDGMYEKKMKFLIRNDETNSQSVDFKKNLLENFLSYIKENNLLADITMYYDTDIRSYIEDFTDDIVSIKVYDEYGRADGITIVPKDRIRIIYINSVDETNRDLLVKNQI